jgi:hypothetical protein
MLQRFTIPELGMRFFGSSRLHFHAPSGTLQGQDCKDRAVRKGQLDRTARTGLTRQDSQDRTFGTGLPGQGCQNRTTSTGLPRRDCMDRTTGTGLQGQDCRDRTAGTGLPGLWTWATSAAHGRQEIARMRAFFFCAQRFRFSSCSHAFF